MDTCQATAAIHTFPFAYLGLGLPVKPTTLSRLDSQPLLHEVDRRLPSWKGHNLSRGRRPVLIKPILAQLPLYCMSFYSDCNQPARNQGITTQKGEGSRIPDR